LDFKIFVDRIEIDTKIFIVFENGVSLLQIEDKDKILQLRMSDCRLVYIRNYTIEKAERLMDYCSRHMFRLQEKCSKVIENYKIVYNLNKELCVYTK